MPIMKIYLGAVPKVKSQDKNISVDRGKKELADNGFLWTKVKEAFARSGDETAILSVGALRSAQVNAMLAAMGNRQKCRNLAFCAVGSTNPTSDYDITVDGQSDMEAMREFNQDFVVWIKQLATDMKKTAYPYESGMVFDINLYVAGYLPVAENVRGKAVQFASLLQKFSGSEQNAAKSARIAKAGQNLSKAVAAERGEGKILWEGVTEEDFEKNLEPDVLKLGEERQDIYTLTKLRKYCTAQEWVEFKEELHKVVSGSEDWSVTERRLKFAEKIVAEYVAETLKRCNSAPSPGPTRSCAVPTSAPWPRSWSCCPADTGSRWPGEETACALWPWQPATSKKDAAPPTPNWCCSPPGAICRTTPPTTPPAAICNPCSTWSTPTARTPSWPR